MVSKAKKPARKPRATKAKKTTKAAAAPAAPPAAPAKKVAKKTPVKDESTLADAFVHVLGQLTSLRSQLTNITGQVRTLAKRADRELRAAQKAGKKRMRQFGKVDIPQEAFIEVLRSDAG